MRENVRIYLKQNVSKCWRCGQSLTEINMDDSRYLTEMTCPKCGFIVEATSKVNKIFGWSIVIGFVIAGFAFLLGRIL